MEQCLIHFCSSFTSHQSATSSLQHKSVSYTTQIYISPTVACESEALLPMNYRRQRTVRSLSGIERRRVGKQTEENGALRRQLQKRRVMQNMKRLLFWEQKSRWWPELSGWQGLSSRRYGDRVLNSSISSLSSICRRQADVRGRSTLSALMTFMKHPIESSINTARQLTRQDTGHRTQLGRQSEPAHHWGSMQSQLPNTQTTHTSVHDLMISDDHRGLTTPTHCCSAHVGRQPQQSIGVAELTRTVCQAPYSACSTKLYW